MKVACLQFNPTLGNVKQNTQSADALLEPFQPGQLDLLVLPELAFTGYNFPSLKAIEPHLEPTSSGPTSIWAVATARRLRCHVFVGYPELWADTQKYYESPTPMCFNSLLMVSPEGEVVGNYRKSFLYYTDETWASEGHLANTPGVRSALQSPFFVGKLERPNEGSEASSSLKTGAGICMDLNPWRFVQPWTDFEFANTMLTHQVRLVVLSMAWLTHRSEEEFKAQPYAPDMETVAYWTERLQPFVTSKPREEIIVVFANRCGAEGKAKPSGIQNESGEDIEEGDRVCYAGSSCVMKFQNGEVRMFSREKGVAILGKAEEGVLVVDTESPATYALKSQAP